MTHPPWDPFDLAAWAKAARLREEARSDPFIIIDYRSNTDTWSAWWTDSISLLGRFDGTREQAIAWARERSDNIRICSDPHDDNAPPVQLGPEDQ